MNTVKSVSKTEDIHHINKKDSDHNNDTLCTIGTSSLRRRSQIKNRYKKYLCKQYKRKYKYKN